jgi:hypothetical protein
MKASDGLLLSSEEERQIKNTLFFIASMREAMKLPPKRYQETILSDDIRVRVAHLLTVASDDMLREVSHD